MEDAVEYERGVSAIIPVATAAYEVTVQVRAAYISIEGRGPLSCIAEARQVQRRIELAMRDDPRTMALFDRRASELFPEDVADHMWSWISGTFQRCGLVFASEMMCVQANMVALMRGARVRAFSSRVMAINWLLQV